MNRELAGRTAIAIGTTVLLLTATAGTNAMDKLALKVTPNVSNAPSTVIVRATVAKDSRNRVLQIGADSGSFYSSSEIQLDGARAPRVTEIRLKDLPSGEYTVVAVLLDELGRQTKAWQTIRVLTGPGEP